MLDLKALPVMRKNLDAFIRADPIDVVLERSQKVDSGAGGFVKNPPVNLPSQQFRLVPFKRRLYDYTQRTANGGIPVEQFALVGRVAVDIQRDDEFLLNGDRYRIVSLEPQMNDRSKSDRVVAFIEVQVEDETNPDTD